MAAVDTSLHQRWKREGTPVSPKVARGDGRGCSHPARAPRGAQPHGATAHTPMQGEGQCPMVQQFSGDISLCGQETLRGSPESIPPAAQTPQGRGSSPASTTPDCTWEKA